MGLCDYGQRSKWWLTGGPRNLEEFYGAQASPFTIFYYWDHFCIAGSWFYGVLMIFVILVIIGHNLIKYTKCVIGTISS
jgi:hypothetical protein